MILRITYDESCLQVMKKYQNRFLLQLEEKKIFFFFFLEIN